MTTRCEWFRTDSLHVACHDDEQGVPVHDDRVLFEFLVLEGAQARFSRSTILSKRTSRRAHGKQSGTPLAWVAQNITLF